MSTLSVSNITDGTTTVATGYVVNGSAKAHVSVNENSTLGVNSLNISSISDVSTGTLDISMSSAFISPMQNCGIGSSVNGGPAGSTVRGANASITTSLFSVRSYDGSNTLVDLTWQAHVFHGDLA